MPALGLSYAVNNKLLTKRGLNVNISEYSPLMEKNKKDTRKVQNKTQNISLDCKISSILGRYSKLKQNNATTVFVIQETASLNTKKDFRQIPCCNAICQTK